MESASSAALGSWITTLASLTSQGIAISSYQGLDDVEPLKFTFAVGYRLSPIQSIPRMEPDVNPTGAVY
jgi:hypothetical protein